MDTASDLKDDSRADASGTAATDPGRQAMLERFAQLRHHLAAVIVGQTALIDRLMVATLCGGHLLLEGLPGLAKTTAVRALAGGLNLEFQRIQFTPDLIPGDITGSDILHPAEGGFRFVPGPIFHEVILADEINRAPPKVQSALLEAMQEAQVTVGGQTHGLPKVFIVIATQNPLDAEGVYPLPEAQMDRFMMKVNIDYPSADDELEILQRHLSPAAPRAPEIGALDAPQLLDARGMLQTIYLDEMLARYIVALVGATRDPSPWDPSLSEQIEWGASPRASLALAQAARAHALLLGRDFVEPGDIIEYAGDVLNHRLAPSFEARAQGVDSRQIIQRLLDLVPIP